MKKIITLFVLLFFLIPLTGCEIGNEINRYRPVTDVNNLDGRRIAVVIAWSEDYILSKREDMTILRYETLADALMALSYKKVDAVAVDVPSASMTISNLEGVEVLEPAIDEVGMVYVTLQEDLRNEFNEFLLHFKNTEKFYDIQNHVFDFHDVYEKDLTEIKEYPGARTIKVAVDDEYYPIAFYDIPTKTVQGYDMKVMKEFAEYKHYNLELIAGTYTSNLQLLNSGKVDFMCEGSVIAEKDDYERTGAFVTDIVYIDKICLIGLNGKEKMRYKY